MTLTRTSLPAFLILSAALLAACNKKEGTTIEVTANDQMQFSTKAIEVAAGAPVTLILKNVGTMPKESMAHNFTLLQAGTVISDFGTKAMTAKATDYIPAGDPAVIAHTRLLGPGETDTLRFTAPSAGEYPFMCTFPGHFAVMNGTLTAR